MKLGLLVLHSEFVHDVPRSPIFSVGHRHDPLQSESTKSVIEPRPRRFGAYAPSPVLLYHAVSDLDLIRAIERLEPRRSDHLASWFPKHSAHSKPVRSVARNIEPDPSRQSVGILGPCPAHKPDHFRIRSCRDQRMQIVDGKFPKYQTLGLDHRLNAKNVIKKTAPVL